jgi:large repetitive protein
VGVNGHIYLADSGNARVIEEIPGAAANLGSVAVGSPSTPVTMLFAFSGVQTGITPSVVTQGTPGLDFADALSGTCTTNGTDNVYDTTTSGNYKVGANLFCSVNIILTPAFPGGRFGAASLIQAGRAAATGYAYGRGGGPQVVFTNPGQGRVDSAESAAAGIAADSAGNLYVSDDNTSTVILVAPGGGVTTVTTGSALSSPSGVAVDGAGNVYIADTGNARILEI